MQINDILTLYNYNYWANARILAATAKVPAAQFTAPAQVSHGSLRGTLVHILSAEWMWRKRCQERVSPAAMLAEAEFPTLATLQTHWQAEEQAMRSFLTGLHDEDLAQVVSYTRTSGSPYENTLWHLLVHVVNHGTQFRGEAAVLLSEWGYSPGDLDFIAFLREQN